MDYQDKQEIQTMLNNALSDIPDEQYIDRKFYELKQEIDSLERQLRKYRAINKPDQKQIKKGGVL